MEYKQSDRIRKINYLSSELDALYHRASQKLGISDSVSIVLYNIYEEGDGCLLSEIYKKTGISKQTVNSAIRGLERDGFLFLEPYKGHAKKIRLTEQGQSYIEQTVARLYQAECDAYQSWTEEEMSQYLMLMEKYSRCLREEIDKM